MVLENLDVHHKAFGHGKVMAKNGQYITVKFEAVEKVFVYPDIFEKFLTLADGTVCDEIKSDIALAKAEKQRIIDTKNEENERARTRGIVIPGKEFNPNESEEEEGASKATVQEEI